jgi:simple sugar transport system permease protein
MSSNEFNINKIRNFVIDNLVVIIFVTFIIAGFIVSGGVSPIYFLNELIDRVFRNIFLVLSLIIPVVAGLGLNFGIVVGAMAGQFALIFVRYHDIGGLGGLMLCFLFALPIALLFGFLTGKLYNKVRGQEMIASLIVGYFAQGIYNFILLFAVGVIIPVRDGHPMIKFDNIGIRMSVDLGLPIDGGMKYALDNIIRVPFIHLVLIASIGFLIFVVIQFLRRRKRPGAGNSSPWRFGMSCLLSVGLIIFSLVAIITNSDLMFLRRAPLVTALVVFALCLFLHLIMKTKLGQDFRSVGHNQHIAEVSGINVDRTRIIATIFSTVLAAWGMIIFLQNMGTLATYDSHRNIGLFSVAALLVGGASTSRAGVKNALIGAALFNAMTIISPEMAVALFGDPASGEYFRSFMVYGVIGLALGLYVWKTIKASKDQNAL